MAKLQANGIQFYYEVHGPENGDWLVLSNGVLMSTTSWAYQIPELARHYRLLLYDCRGMWESDHPPGPYSMEGHADDLASIMDGLEIPDAHIGGISYGAEISMLFALRYPNRVRSLILSSAVSELDPQLAGMTESWIAAARTRDPEMFFQVSYPVNFSASWIGHNRETLEAARQRYRTLDMVALLELLLSFRNLNITDRLGEISAPALVIVGEEDILKPRRNSEIIARKIPEADLAIVPHAGHAVLWEQWRVFNALILGFLGRQRGKTQPGSPAGS